MKVRLLLHTIINTLHTTFPHRFDHPKINELLCTTNFKNSDL